MRVSLSTSNASNIQRAQETAGLKKAIRHQLFIGRKFFDAESGETLTSVNPHDNSPIADVAMAGKANVDKAVAAAKAAFPVWARTGASERGAIRELLQRALDGTRPTV
jgi:betaine-aldehyde dehydrogenase